jgi:hypothetical protein
MCSHSGFKVLGLSPPVTRLATPRALSVDCAETCIARTALESGPYSALTFEKRLTALFCHRFAQKLIRLQKCHPHPLDANILDHRWEDARQCLWLVLFPGITVTIAHLFHPSRRHREIGVIPGTKGKEEFLRPLRQLARSQHTIRSPEVLHAFGISTSLHLGHRPLLSGSLCCVSAWCYSCGRGCAETDGTHPPFQFFSSFILLDYYCLHPIRFSVTATVLEKGRSSTAVHLVY